MGYLIWRLITWGEQALFSLEIKKNSLSSSNPDIHHSKVPSSELKTSELIPIALSEYPLWKLVFLILYFGALWLVEFYALYRRKIIIIWRLRKRGDQPLISIFIILKFSTLGASFTHTAGNRRCFVLVIYGYTQRLRLLNRAEARMISLLPRIWYIQKETNKQFQKTVLLFIQRASYIP